MNNFNNSCALWSPKRKNKGYEVFDPLKSPPFLGGFFLALKKGFSMISMPQVPQNQFFANKECFDKVFPL